MVTLPIVVYGSGDVFREYFNAIVTSLLPGSGFESLIRIAIAVSAMAAIYGYIMKRDISALFKWFGLYYLAMNVLFLPKISVEIIDRVNQGHVYSVQNVPLGLGLVASYASIIGDKLTQILEMNFTMPDDLHYGQTGMVMASRMVTEASQFQIIDSAFNANMQSFVQQCIFYDVLLKKYSLENLATAKDVWSFVSDNTSKARAFIYNGQVTACNRGAASFTRDWKTVIDTAYRAYGQRVFPHLGAEQAKTQLMKYLPLSYSFLTKVATDASNVMQQNIMANAIENGMVHMNATTDASAALQSYAFSRTEVQQRMTHNTLGEMAAHWLPIMKNAFEAIMYGCFIFILLLTFLPIGPRILLSYIYSILWLQMWAPLYAIINLMCSYYAMTQSSAATQGAVTLKNISGLLQINQDLSGLAGYLSLSVPFIAAGIVRGMASTFTHLAQYIGGVTQSIGSTAAAEAATGNLGFGNANLGNTSAFNMSANHLDTMGRAYSGGMSYQTSSGESMSVMPDGTMVADSSAAISNLGANVNLAGAISTSASMQADRAFEAAQSASRSYDNSVSTAMRQASELSVHHGTSTSDGQSWGIQTSAETQHALSQMNSTVRQFAHDHSISYGEAAEVLNQASANIGIHGDASLKSGGAGGAGLSGGLGAEAGFVGRTQSDVRSNYTNNQLYRDAKEYSEKTDYASNLNTIMRAVHDHNVRADTEEGKRLVDNLCANLDRAETYRNDATSNFRKAEDYRKVASLTQENSAGFNINAGQQLFEWMAQQPGTNGQGHLGYHQAATMSHDNPALFASYVERFTQMQSGSIRDQFAHSGLAHSSGDISHAAAVNNASVGSGLENLENHFKSSEKQVINNATNAGISSGGKITNDVTKHQMKVEGGIGLANETIQRGHDNITQQGKETQTQVHDEQQRERHHGAFRDLISPTGVDTKNYGDKNQ